MGPMHLGIHPYARLVEKRLLRSSCVAFQLRDKRIATIRTVGKDVAHSTFAHADAADALHQLTDP